MKCNAAARKKQQEESEELFKFFLMMCWVLNHKYGFGIGRINGLYEGLSEINHELEKYQTTGGDNTAGFDRLTQWGLDMGILEKKGDRVCLK